MKVLVATRRTQGKRPTDHAHCIDGELLWMVEACWASTRNPYGECECGRTFRGLYSDAVTTTALVKDIVGMTRDDYVTALTASHDNRPGCTCDFDPDRIADELLERAARLPEGAVVERCVRRLTVRQLQAR